MRAPPSRWRWTRHPVRSALPSPAASAVEEPEEFGDGADRRSGIAPAYRHDGSAHRRRSDEPDRAERPRAELRREGHAREQGDAEPLGDHLLRGLHVVELDDALGYDTGLPHERARELVVAGRAVEQDEVVLRQLLEPDTAAARERLVSADD